MHNEIVEQILKELIVLRKTYPVQFECRASLLRGNLRDWRFYILFWEDESEAQLQELLTRLKYRNSFTKTIVKLFKYSREALYIGEQLLIEAPLKQTIIDKDTEILCCGESRYYETNKRFPKNISTIIVEQDHFYDSYIG